MLSLFADQEREAKLDSLGGPCLQKSNNVLRRRLLNWHHVLYCATYSAKGGSRQFQTWAKHSAHLLGLMGITPFLGFKWIVAPEAPDLNKRVFWKGSNGIAGLVPPDISEFGDRPVFFTNQVKE